ncbi:MAG TPA: vWA domain-containing protein [Thermoleophilaceae bacterium]
MRSRSLAAAVIGLAALVIATTSSASSTGTAAQTCVPKNNVEAIIDDSGSMIITDGDRLRVRAMELFIDNPANARRTLGALEFGTDAAQLFAPGPLTDANRAAMKSAINAAVNADNGLTDYNDAFAAAGAQNPTATARIFLTDGGHNNESSTPYDNSHRGGPPVYVIGLGVVGDSDQVLKQIAAETNGLYRPVDTASELQSAMFDVNAAIGCLATPITLRNTFTRQGQTAKRSIRLPGGVRSVNTALSWDDENDAFDIAGIHVVRKGKTVAAAKVRKLKITKRRGATNVTVKISRLVRGRLVFRLKATKLTGGGSAQLTTQVVRSRRR